MSAAHPINKHARDEVTCTPLARTMEAVSLACKSRKAETVTTTSLSLSHACQSQDPSLLWGDNGAKRYNLVGVLFYPMHPGFYLIHQSGYREPSQSAEVSIRSTARRLAPLFAPRRHLDNALGES